MYILEILFCDLQDKNKLLRQWLQNNKCDEACEASFTVDKTNSTELCSGKVSMTMKDMIDAGFSKYHDSILWNVFKPFLPLYRTRCFKNELQKVCFSRRSEAENREHHHERSRSGRP